MAGGRGGWEGAFALHVGHLSLVDLISEVIPGQYIIEIALAVMPPTPWWAEWRADRHWALRAVWNDDPA